MDSIKLFPRENFHFAPYCLPPLPGILSQLLLSMSGSRFYLFVFPSLHILWEGGERNGLFTFQTNMVSIKKNLRYGSTLQKEWEQLCFSFDVALDASSFYFLYHVLLSRNHCYAFLRSGDALYHFADLVWLCQCKAKRWLQLAAEKWSKTFQIHPIYSAILPIFLACIVWKQRSKRHSAINNMLTQDTSAGAYFKTYGWSWIKLRSSHCPEFWMVLKIWCKLDSQQSGSCNIWKNFPLSGYQQSYDDRELQQLFGTHSFR